MSRLIKNELTKIFKKRSLYITLFVILAFVILTNCIYKFFYHSGSYHEYSDNYIKYAKEELEGYIVKNIDQYASYQEEAVILITPSDKYKSEILAVLKKKGFKNCEWIDVRMIG